MQDTLLAVVEEIRGLGKVKFGAYFDNVDCTVEHDEHPEFFQNCKALIEKELNGKLAEDFREVQHDLYNDTVRYYFTTNLSENACYLLIDLLHYAMYDGTDCMMYLDHHEVPYTEDDLREIMGEDYSWNRNNWEGGLDIDTVIIPGFVELEVNTVITQSVQEMMEENGTVFNED